MGAYASKHPWLTFFLISSALSIVFYALNPGSYQAELNAITGATGGST